MRTSINVRYDYSDSNLIENYIPTDAHLRFLNSVFNGVINKKSKSAHLMFGPYGSGKSYICSLITGILSKEYGKNDINKLSEKMLTIDQKYGDVINRVSKINRSYIPILLNGYEGEFNSVLIRSIVKQLDMEGISVYLPTHFSIVEKTIDMWEEKYFITYTSFISRLDELQITMKDFLQQIRAFNTKYLDWFKMVFRDLTAGQELQLPLTDRAHIVLEEICKELDKRNLGIIIVYDEFGRYMQQVEKDKIDLFMQELQDLSELANNGVDNLELILISHKPVNQYFLSLPEEMRKEFVKIEKRFSSTEIRSEYEMFLSIASGFIEKEKNSEIDAKIFENWKNKTQDFTLFNEYNWDLSSTNEIIQKMYPLHPVTTLLVPKVSSVFGQNERTLFTFLNDESKYGLYEFIKSSNKIYYPDFLVDYFFLDYSELDTEEQKHLTLFNKLIGKTKVRLHDDIIEISERILKFIFIWNVVMSNSNIQVSIELISFALDTSKSEIKKTLEELIKVKVVRFNLLDNQYELIDSSGIDLELEIVKEREEKPFSEKEFIELINKININKYVVAEKYSSINDITRFGRIYYVTNKNDVSSLFENADIQIIINIGDKKIFFKDSIIGKYSGNIETLRFLAEKLFYIRNLQNKKTIYNNLFHVELEYEKLLILSKINKELDSIFYNSKFTYNDQRYSFSNFEEISNFLSKMFIKKYSRYLYITNEQVNMFKISNVQEKAIINNIISILENKTLEELKQGRNSPSNLILHSIINRSQDVENISIIRQITEEIEEKLFYKPKGQLSDLYMILVNPPYGMRPSIAILLGTFILNERWENMTFYKNETFIPNLTPESLYESLRVEINNNLSKPFTNNKIIEYYNPIEYVYNHFDFQNQDFLVQLKELFGESSEYIISRSLSVETCSSMHSWLIDLPIITQQGLNLGISEKRLLEIIKKTRIDPTSALTELHTFAEDVEIVKMLKENIEDHFRRYLNSFETSIMNEIGEDFMKNIENNHEKNPKFNKISKALLEKTSIIEMFASEVDEIEIKYWTADMFEKLKRLILANLSSNKNFEVSKVLIGNEEFLIRNVKLSIKAETTAENLENIIKATKRYMSQDELENILLDLLRKYVR